MPPAVLYYVSGHGYGHARRAGAVIQALLALRPDVRIHVRTTAHPSVFPPELQGQVSPTGIDFKVVERGPLVIDAAVTLANARDLLDRRDEVVAAEVATVREPRTSLVVADIPFLAGDVAVELGVACVGVSNFTWDWILEPLAEAAGPAFADVPRRIARGYGRMTVLLRMPLGGIWDVFPRVVPVPLVAPTSSLRDPDDVLQALGVSPTDPRPRVLVSLRGGVPPQTLLAAAAESPGLLFLHLMPELPDGAAPNVKHARPGPGLSFDDLLVVSDAVVSKLGYGIVADCIANQVPLVWPRRFGFREDEIVERDGPAYLRMVEVPDDEFTRGNWGRGISAALSLPPPCEKMRTDGAEVCAALIEDYLREPSYLDEPSGSG